MVENRSQYAHLRKVVHLQQQQAIKERKKRNPLLTPEEQTLGIYLEELEPQVRPAVLNLLAKGYPTYSSGFYDLDCRYQVIEGKFRLDDQTINRLYKYDVEVLSGVGKDFGISEEFPSGNETLTIIQFKAGSVDLQQLQQRWIDVVSLIPDRK